MCTVELPRGNDSSFHNGLNTEEEMRTQMFSVKPNIKEICKTIPLLLIFFSFGQ